MRGTEYKHVYVIKNTDTNEYVATYWASSQKYKALFVKKALAERVIKRFEGNYEIVEL